MIKWINAIRLRTLPLALSCVLLGSALAIANGFHFHYNIFTWTIITTILLQIVSNLANDYGDWQNGADNHLRVGQKRAVQSGEILPQKMLGAVIFVAILALFSGIYLLFLVSDWIPLSKIATILALGIFAIIAALTYTSGKNPYGYKGLGDLSVFLFFGIIGVLGTLFLQTGEFGYVEIVPATALGCLAVAVLNLNNLRDIKSDTFANKRTIPVRIGEENAKKYHYALLLISFFGLNGYSFLMFNDLVYSLAFIASSFGSFYFFWKVKDAKTETDYDVLLKPTALYAFILSLILFIAIQF